MKTHLLLFGLLLLSGCTSSPNVQNSCASHLRAGLDVGSGTSKLTLSEVAVCEHDVRLLRVIDDQSSVALPLEAGKDASGNFTTATLDSASQTFRDLHDKAISLAQEKAPLYKEIEFSAVGTQALRTAKNPEALIARAKAAGIPLIAITQDQEGEFGYRGALTSATARVSCGTPEIAVWDIGGGSMQVTSAPSANAPVLIEKVGFGAEAFKTRLLQTLPKHRPMKSCPTQEPSPNPIGKKQIAQAIQLAEKMAKESLKRSLANDAKTCWIGIGGVHSKAIEAQIRKNFAQIKSCVCEKTDCTHEEGRYTEKELFCLAQSFSDKNDCDDSLKGPYSSTAVSNLLMVLGFMKHLGADRVTTANVTMGQSLVLDAGHLTWNTERVPKK